MDEDDLKNLLDEIDSDPLQPEPETKAEVLPMKVERTNSADIVKDDEDFSGDLKHMLGNFRQVFESVLDDCRADRKQTQDAIDHFFNQITLPGKVPSVYIEKFPDLLKTKNDIATTAIRAMDSFTKLVSATKGSEMLQSVNVNFDADSLEKLLQQGEEDG